MERMRDLTHQEVIARCEAAFQQGRTCQLKLTYSAVQSEVFQSWVFNLYQRYPAHQIKQQLRFVDQGDRRIRQVLDHLLPTAAFTQWNRNQKIEDLKKPNA